MRKQNLHKQSGFTIFEIVIGLTIFVLVANFITSLATDYIHRNNVERTAGLLSQIPKAVQIRNSHDGFDFALWDENGGDPAGDVFVSFPEATFTELFSDYLVGHDNAQCGDGDPAAALPNFWNPVNTTGTPDGGDVTAMDRTALISCTEFRNQLPFNVDLSAIITGDVTGAVDTFALYVGTDNIDFGLKDQPDNNILNYQLLKSVLIDDLKTKYNGEPRIEYGLVNLLDNIADDTVYTADECEAELIAGRPCNFLIYTEYTGTNVGVRKRTDNLDYFLDDVTFGRSIAEGRQRCAYWEQVGAGFNPQVIDCAILAGANDDQVSIVFDEAQFQEVLITTKAGVVGAEVNTAYLCNEYAADANGHLSENGRVTPCGITRNGDLVQMISDTTFTQNSYAENVVAESIHANGIEIHRTGVGSLISVRRSTNYAQEVFTVDGNGNTSLAGTLTVEGEVIMQQSATINESLLVQLQSAGASVVFGSAGNSLTLSKIDGISFDIEADTNEFSIRRDSNDNAGITISNSAVTNGDSVIELKANEGVFLENGTQMYGSRSTFTDEDFTDLTQAANQGSLDSARLVTSDMAKYLDDTSSPIQIVGVDRVEGDGLALNKPNCLAFMNSGNFSAGVTNPYESAIATLSYDENNPTVGYGLARLILVPKFFKTYNSAFGDNQIYVQHAINSSPSQWEIFLYLTGEGAFATGAREDAAGGSLALTLCDYTGINLSQQSF